MRLPTFFFFFFNDTATTEIYTLSLHDALPIFLITAGLTPQVDRRRTGQDRYCRQKPDALFAREPIEDRKSTRLNSSHLVISYAVFCLKKKKRIESNSKYKMRDRVCPTAH